MFSVQVPPRLVVDDQMIAVVGGSHEGVDIHARAGNRSRGP